MNRLWSLKTWSSVLLLVALALGLTAILAVHRLYLRAAEAEEYAERIAATPDAAVAGATPADSVLLLETEFRLWTGALAALTTLAAIFLVLHRRHLQRYLIHPMQRLAGYLDRVALGERFLQLPPQQEPALNQVVSSGNVLIERFNRYVEESRRTGTAAREHAQAIIETFSDIALLVNEAGEPVMTNRAVKNLPAASSLEDLSDTLQTVVAGERSEIDLAGRSFIVVESLPAETRGFSGALIILREKPAGADENERGARPFRGPSNQ